MTSASQNPQDTYSADFYSDQVEGSLRSANVVVPMVLTLLGDIDSVIDVGCGTGAWLSVFKGNGVKEIRGIDGGSIPSEHFLIERNEFTAHSLTEPLDLEKKYAMAMSLEVAEHLEEEYAAGFVKLLCDASDLVLFGAAIPAQGGHNHVNERWPSYWKALFEKNGYEIIDIIRPRIWTDNRVEWWYRQNTLLFIKSSRKVLLSRLKKEFNPPSQPLDTVHPDCFLMHHHARTRSIRKTHQQTMEWLSHSTNETHKAMCDEWLEDMLGDNIKTVSLFCAGGNAGLGPYLLLRCNELGIKVSGYVEHLEDSAIDFPVSVNIIDKKDINKLNDPTTIFLVASPAFATKIIHNIKEILGDDHPEIRGVIN